MKKEVDYKKQVDKSFDEMYKAAEDYSKFMKRCRTVIYAVLTIFVLVVLAAPIIIAIAK